MNMNFAVVDLETNRKESGRYAQILEVGIAWSDGEKILEEYESLVKSPDAVCSFITELTGIHDEMLVDAPDFAQIGPELFKKLQNTIFVAHNVGYDYGHLRFHLAGLGMNLRGDKLCTIKACRGLYPGLGGYGLAQLCKEFGISLKGHHRALADARATAELLHVMIADHGVEKVMSYADQRLRPENLPPLLDAGEIDSLPELAGVLWVWNDEGRLLVVKSMRDLYRGFMELHQTWSRKSTKTWNGAAKVEFKTLPSSVLGRLLAAHAQNRHKPILQRGHRTEIPKSEISEGWYVGRSSTGARYRLLIRDFQIQAWEWLGRDAGSFVPPLALPAFIRTAILQSKLVIEH